MGNMTTDTDSLLGRQLDEYRLEALLGHGGMARVYRALDVRLKRYAAIKVIDTPLRADPEFIKRFEREAQAIAQLDHPHIVSLYRYGEAGGLLYMAMRYVEGVDLHTLLAGYRGAGEFIPPDDAARIVREVSQALDYAHQNGVIHRDVKPSNIVLDRQGRAFLTDFGLALLKREGTWGRVHGSPHYIAPEQVVSSARAVPQSDLYAVGVILYEMFAGELPFQAEKPLEIARLHLSEPPRPPRELRPELSPDLEAVILKALAKEPEARYQSGAALSGALERALRPEEATLPILAPPTEPYLSIPERIAAEVADHPLPYIPDGRRQSADSSRPRTSAGALVGVVLLAAACLAIAAWLMFRGDRGIAGGQGTQIGQAPTPEPSPPAPAAIPTSEPTPTLPAIIPPTPTQAPAYDLLIVRDGDDALYVVNQSEEDFPLTPLRMGRGERAIEGAQWEIEVIGPDDCVVASKAGADKDEEGELRLPNDLTCDEAGERVIRRRGRDRFWDNTFEVYYNEELVGECVERLVECPVAIPVH